MQVASLYASFTLESASFITPMRNIVDETEKASRKMQQEHERLARAADRLLSSVDPVHAAQSRLNKQMDEAKRLYNAGAISAEQFAMAESNLKARLEQATSALTTHNAVSAQSQYRMRLLGYQISDVGVQLAGGQNPFLILAQQGPQVANALDGMNNRVGKFATFLSGPWGATLLAAGSIVGVLASKLWESHKATKDHAEASKTLEEALEDLDRVTGRSNKLTEEQIRLNEQAAVAKLDEVVATHDKIKAELEWQRVTLQSQKIRAGGVGPLADSAAMQLAGTYREIDALSKKMAKEAERIKNAQEALRGAQAARVMQEVTEKVDAAAAATARYERASAALRKEFEAADSSMTEAEYARREEALRRVRDAELKAAQEASKKRVSIVDKELGAINSLIGQFLTERAAVETYAERLDLLDKGLKRGRLSADELALAVTRVRQAMLDDLGLEKIAPKIAEFDADKETKKGLPKFNARELLDLESVRGFSAEIERTAERARQLDQAAMSFATNMTSSFEDALFSGKGLKSVFTGLLEDMGKMVLRLTVLEPLARAFANALKGSSLGGGGGIFSAIGSMFGGARANGGPVSSGRTYLVGERGPELFTPSASGNIIPNGALKGMAGAQRIQIVPSPYFDAVVQGVAAPMVQRGSTLAAAGGSAMAQDAFARRARRKL